MPSFEYNDQVYKFAVLEIRPEGPGISVIETDLEVDFAAPVGYVEPTRTVAKAVSSSIEAHVKHEPVGTVVFSGSGNRLSGKTQGVAAYGATVMEDSVQGVPAVLQLPPGRLYFGYPVVPLKKAADAEEGKGEKWAGKGSSLRKAK
jgi:ubiquitin fusion degradation protein 1